MPFDPTVLTVASLTSPLGIFVMCVLLTEAVKDAAFTDTAWRDRFTPLLAPFIGLAYATICANITGQDVGALGLYGFGAGCAAVVLYRRGLGSAVDLAQSFFFPPKSS